MGLIKAGRQGVTRVRMDLADEMNNILMAEPYLIAFVYGQKHFVMLEEDREIIACTDGKITEYGPKYSLMSLPERAYICVHEIGHGSFMHPQRAMLWMLFQGFFFPVLWNYAADVVINEGIEANPMMRNGLFERPKMFPPCLMKTTIHDTIAEVVKKTGEKPPSDYDAKIYKDLKVETIYEWLVWALFAMRRHRKQDVMTGRGQSEPGGPGGQNEPANDRTEPGDETRIERMEREDAWDLREQLDDVRRLIEEGQSTDEIIRSINAEIDVARAKIQDAVQGMKLAGSGHGSMLMNLSSDLPPATVPWHKILYRAINGAIGTRLDVSYSRFGSVTRTMLARGDRQVPYTPGTTIFNPRPRILVGQDVSGSMWNELRRCCSEIWSMAQLKNAEIDLVTWDDGIQEKMTIKSRTDFDAMLRKGLRGGGGTALVEELFQYATAHGHQAIVIMTDGYIDIQLPRKPDIPVIWAVTPGGATRGLEEYGTIVRMTKETPAGEILRAA